MKLTAEYVEEHGLTSFYMARSNPDFKLVYNSIIGYNEGNVCEIYIYESNEDGTLWGFETNEKSGDESC